MPSYVGSAKSSSGIVSMVQTVDRVASTRSTRSQKSTWKHSGRRREQRTSESCKRRIGNGTDSTNTHRAPITSRNPQVNPSTRPKARLNHSRRRSVLDSFRTPDQRRTEVWEMPVRVALGILARGMRPPGGRMLRSRRLSCAGLCRRPQRQRVGQALEKRYGAANEPRLSV